MRTLLASIASWHSPPCQTWRCKISTHMNLIFGNAALRYPTSLLITLCSCQIERVVRSFPPKLRMTSFGGSSSNTSASMLWRSFFHPSPLTHFHAIEWFVLMLGFPVFLASWPAQYGIESPMIHISIGKY